MGRKILVAVDGSQTTQRVLQAVKELVLSSENHATAAQNGRRYGHGRNGYEVTLLHVVPPYLDSARVHVPHLLEELMDVEEMFRTVTVRHGEAVVEQAAHLLEEGGIYPRLKVAVGSPSECICEEAFG